MSDKVIYLDHAAATPLADEVLAAMKPYWQAKFHNPSAVYLASRAVKQDLEQYRARVAHWLGARANEIIFTAGASESDNLAIHGIMQNYPKANLAISAIEHEAVIEAATGYDFKTVAVDGGGRITTDSLAQAIDDNTVLVSVMQANNEIGTIQPLGDLFAVINKIRTSRRETGNKLPLYFHSDASQSAQYLDLHANRLGVDLMSLNAGKIYGPKQVGGLYARSGLKLSPLIKGGGQERGLRSGTENVAGAAAMATALELVQSQRDQESIRVSRLRDQLENRLKKRFGDLVVHGGRHRLPNNLSFHVPGIDGERAVMELDELGLQCATGSACSALRDESSHVLKAIGLSEPEASASLRFSLGRATTEAEIEQAAGLIETVINKLKGSK